MSNKIYKIILSFAFVLLPIFSFAQKLEKTGDLFWAAKDIVTGILIPLAFVLSLLFFFWGVAKYIWEAGQGKDEGKKIMIWGVVALFVITSVWGLVAFLQRDLLGGPGPNSIPIPTIGGEGGGGGTNNFPNEETELNH